jgi:hypothetical protein
MVNKIKEETWALTSADTVAIPSSTTYRNDGTANTWSDIWKYQVPSGQVHVLKPGHRFSAVVKDTTTAAVGDGTCRLRIEVRDQSEQDKKVIYGPALYVSSKEFQQDDKMARLGLQNDLVVEEKFWIVIQGYDDATIDESLSYFKLETLRIRSTI